MGALRAEGYPDEAAYWHLVFRSMIDLFGVAPDEADRLVHSYVWQLAQASPAERLLVFHAEALHVAADLSGMSEIGDKTVEQYLALRDRHPRAAAALGA